MNLIFYVRNVILLKVLDQGIALYVILAFHYMVIYKLY